MGKISWISAWLLALLFLGCTGGSDSGPAKMSESGSGSGKTTTELSKVEPLAAQQPMASRLQPGARTTYVWHYTLQAPDAPQEVMNGRMVCTVQSVGSYGGEEIVRIPCDHNPVVETHTMLTGEWWWQDHCFGLRAEGIFEYSSCPTSEAEYQVMAPRATPRYLSRPDNSLESRTFTIQGRSFSGFCTRPANLPTPAPSEPGGDAGSLEICHVPGLGPVQITDISIGGTTQTLRYTLEAVE